MQPEIELNQNEFKNEKKKYVEANGIDMSWSKVS